MEVGVFESSKWQGVERNKSIRIRTGETPGVDWNARRKEAPRPNLERSYINGH